MQMDERQKRRAKALVRAIEDLYQFARSSQNKHGLRAPQWAALRYFSEAPQANRTVGDYARNVGISFATASQTISALDRRGMISRKPSPKDRRFITVQVLPAGEELLRDDPLDLVAEAFQRLEAEEFDALSLAMSKVLRHLEDS